jgi:hypothetical protein
MCTIGVLSTMNGVDIDNRTEGSMIFVYNQRITDEDHV